jgi:putative transposase
VRDNGAFHTAKALRWPPNVATVPFPPDSPALNPMERLWRDLKDQLATSVTKTLDALSDTVCSVIQRYSQAARQSLTGFAYFVQAAQMALHTTNV